MKKKVLFFITTLSFGGTEKATIAYLNKLAELDEVDLYLSVMFKIDSTETLEREISKAVKISYLSTVAVGNKFLRMQTDYAKSYFNKLSYALFKYKHDFLLEREFSKIIEQYNPTTLVQADSVMPNYFSKYRNKKKVIFIHFSIDHIFSNFLKSYRTKNWLSKLHTYDHTIAVSKGIYSQLMPHLRNNQLHLLYNPLSAEDIKQLAKQDVILPEGIMKSQYIVSVGRLDENQKNFTGLINAIGIIRQKYSVDYKLIIVGKGRDLSNLQELVLVKKLNDLVYFIGNKPNPYPYIYNSSLFVLSTKFEGFGIVLQEALLLDKLIISSDCFTGPAEILNHENLLVPVGNDQILADKIHTLLQNQDLQTQMYAHLSNQKEIFNPKKSIEAIADLF